MEKPTISDGSPPELQCVGRLEISRPKPVGFLCGTLPVPTDRAFHDFNSDLVPASETVSAPRYRMLPTETDLNTPPHLPNLRNKVSPEHSKAIGGGMPWEGGAVVSNISRKGEALAVSGLVEHGDEIDVIAPADILKQIFKLSYSKANLSITVHRIGQTLVMNTGPDIDVGENFVKRHKSQSKCTDQSLFLNFAMHSVRMEACDCPPTHHSSSEEHIKSFVFPGLFETTDCSTQSSEAHESPLLGECDASEEGFNHYSEYPKVKQEKSVCSRKKKSYKGYNAVTRVSQVDERSRRSVQESEKYKKRGNDEFLRALFWQFHNFRMLLGSDLLIFSDDKYASVSLHLWDVTQQVTPLKWLEAWLDNVMASVPELAICYHENGVVQGYELLKTNDIFLLKGISDEGTPAFHPYVVQQNGLSVLRFLQKNCKQDPAAYWLYKSAGDDVLQLFDLSVITKTHAPSDCVNNSSSLPSLMHRLRTDSLLSLGTLMYRIAHKLSLSMMPDSKAKCASFFKKCLECLDEPDHLVVRACAHEQFARLLLNFNELDVTSEALPVESEVTIIDAEEEFSDMLYGVSKQIACGDVRSLEFKNNKPVKESEDFNDLVSEHFVRTNSETSITPSESKDLGVTINPSFSDISTEKVAEDLSSMNLKANISSSESNDPEIAQNPIFFEKGHLVRSHSDTVSSKLAAVHHISQAIKSLRWRRQFQSTESEPTDGKTKSLELKNLLLCPCGDPDCIEVCDIQKWLPTSKFDHRLWKLVLLLGESYLALGKAYKDNAQFHQSLKVIELACFVYGSMPRVLEDTCFISSMPYKNERIEDLMTPTYLFWAKAWSLVGDVYVEFHMFKGEVLAVKVERESCGLEMKMSMEVVKEVKRLKKKLSQFNCSSCSLVNCSCKSDRASSNSSASSSNGEKTPKKQAKTSISKTPLLENIEKGFTDGPINGGIFEFIVGPITGDSDHNLSSALRCYEEVMKVYDGFSSSEEVKTVMRKKGWVCNELGRVRLAKKSGFQAEVAFVEAIEAFKKVSDHTNIILINCNLGHGRRSLAEEMVTHLETLKKTLKTHTVVQTAFFKAFERAKLEYRESLRFYGAAKSELNNSVSSNLKNEVIFQFANTYLRLGMLLASEDVNGEINKNSKESKMEEISANEAIREALGMYESLGDLRKQETAYAYLQLASYQKKCCMKFIDLNRTKSAKQYASLAERNWEKCTNFYGPKSHPVMYLMILVERSNLLVKLSSIFHSNLSQMLESALSLLFEALHVFENPTSDFPQSGDSDVIAKFWSELQGVLKKMLHSLKTGKCCIDQHSKNGDVGKVRELYKMSLSSNTTHLDQLQAMHAIWES